MRYSNSKSVFIPANSSGKTYLPYINEITDKEISTITCEAVNIESFGIREKTTTSGYFTIFNDLGVIKWDNVPLTNLSSYYNVGIPVSLNSKINTQQSYLLGTGVGWFLTFFWNDDKRTNSNSIVKKKTIEIPITFTKGTASYHVKFPDILELSGKKIRAIRPAVRFDSSTLSPLGLVLFDTINNSAYITLVETGKIKVDNLWVDSLLDINRIYPVEFDDININLQESYVSIVLSADKDTTESLVLTIEYLED